MAQVKCCDMRSKIFTWNIRNPYFFNDCRIFSPSFSIDSCGSTRYYLEFLTKGYTKELSRTYDVKLFLHEHELHSERGKIVLDIETTVTSDYLKGTLVYIDQTFSKTKKIFHKEFSKSKYDITIEKDNFFLKAADASLKNEINIIFKVNIEQHINCEKAKDLMACKSEDLESLSTDIVNILHNKKFVDLALSIDNKRVRLHKAIFASRYSTLAKSLNILETPKDEYNLDVDYDGLSFLLLYLYSGKISITDSIFELHKLFREAPLFHFQNILYSEPKYVHVSTSFPLKYANFTLSLPKFKELQNDSVVNYLSCDNLLAWTQLGIVFYIGENAEGERSVAFKVQQMEYDRKLLMACKISVVSQETYFKIYNLNSEFRREMDIDSFIKISEIQEKENSFLTDGTLELRFEVVLSNLETVSENDSVECMSGDKRGPLMNLWTLSKDLGSLFMEDKFSDITIENEGSPIAAHKVILCARSPVLCRILEKETERKTIAIKNYDRDTIINLLSYMYSGSLYNDCKYHDWALKLYKAATEYRVAQLKRNCITYIENTLTSDNVPRVLKLAVQCNDASLKATAEKFMHAHVA